MKDMIRISEDDLPEELKRFDNTDIRIIFFR